MAFGAEIARLFVRIGADISELKSGLRDAGHAVDNAVSGFDKVGSKFSSAGRALTVGLTAPIVAIGGLALKASIDFESAFAGVRKTVDGTEEDFARLRKGILDMSKEMPSSAKDIAKVAEAAGQLGVSRDDVLKFTETMIKVGTTTNLAAEDAAVAFARLANIMQIPIDEVESLASVLVDLGNKGASTESQIMDMALRIAGAGHLIGMSATDVLGWANALSSMGIEAEMGGSAISRAFLEIDDAVHQFTSGPSTEQLGAIEDAQRGIQDATQGVAAAQRGAVSAAQTLGDAFTNLARAQRDQVQASLDARRETLSVAEAQQGLTELQARAGSGALELQSAQLALAEAQKRVAEAGKKGGLALQQAQLGVAQAMQRVNEVMAQGPRFALEMQNAELRVAEAKNRVGNAARTQADKIQAANRQIQSSMQGVADAQQRQVQAQRQLTDAHTAMREAVGANSAQLRKIAEVAGMTASEFATLFRADPSGAMVAFVKGLDRIKEAGGNVGGVLRDLGIDEIRLRDTLLRLSAGNDTLVKSLDDARTAKQENMALDKEYAKRVQTTAAQLQIQTNRVMENMIAMGDQLRPVLLDLVKALTPISNILGSMSAAFGKLPGPVQTLVLAFIGLLAIAGPLMSMVGLLIGFKVAVIAIAPFLLAFSAAIGSAGVALAAFLIPALPFIAVAAAIALAAYLIYKNWDGISALFISVGAAIGTALNKVLDFVKNNWQEIAVLLGLPFVGLLALAADAFGIRSALTKAFNAVLDWVRKNWKEIAQLIAAPFAISLVDPFGIRSGLNKAFKDCVKWLYEAGKDLAKGFWDGVKRSWEDSWLGRQARKLEDIVRNPLQAFSPSRVMAGVGMDITAGLALGIRQGGPDVFSAMAMVGNGVGTALTSGLEATAKPAADKVTAILKSMNAAASRELGTLEARTKRAQAIAETLGKRKSPVSDAHLEKAGIYRGWQENSPGAEAARKGGPAGPLGGVWSAGVWNPLTDPAFQQMKTAGVAASQAAGTEMMQGLASGLTQGVEHLRPSFGAAAQVIQESTATIPPIGQRIGEGFTRGLEGPLLLLGPRMTAAGTQIGTSLDTGLQAGIAPIGPKFAANIDAALIAGSVGVAPQAVQAGAGIAAGVAQGMGESVAPQEAANSLSARVTEAFNGTRDWLVQAGTLLMDGLAEGMALRWPTISKWLSGLADKIKKLKGPLDADRVLLVPAGTAIMDGLQDGLIKGFVKQIQPAVSGMAESIAQTFNNGAQGGMQQDVEKWAKTGFPGGEPMASPEAKAFFAQWGQAGVDAFLKRWREVRNLVQIAPNQWAKPGQPATSAAGDLESVARQVEALSGKASAESYRKEWAGRPRNWTGQGSDDKAMLDWMSRTGGTFDEYKQRVSGLGTSSQQAGQGVNRFAVAASSATGATNKAASAMSGAAESIGKAGTVIDTTANALKNLHVGFDFTKPLEPGAGAGQDLGKVKRTPVKGPVGFRVPSLAVGTPRVPEDMLSWLHRGEMVIPRGVADTMRGERGDLQSGGLAMNFNAPFTVVNQERNVDVNKVITEIAYTTQNDLRQRGVRR